jgi:hypothetical protein
MTVQLPASAGWQAGWALGGWGKGAPQQPYKQHSQLNLSSSGVNSYLSFGGGRSKGSPDPRFGLDLVIPFTPRPRSTSSQPLHFLFPPSARPLITGIPLSLLICTAHLPRVLYPPTQHQPVCPSALQASSLTVCQLSGRSASDTLRAPEPARLDTVGPEPVIHPLCSTAPVIRRETQETCPAPCSH